MSMRWMWIATFATLLGLVGCKDDNSSAVDAGPGSDATVSDMTTTDGGGGDSGARDMGRDMTASDSGGADPCATDENGEAAAEFVGCNGGVLGAGEAPGAFGGTCTPNEENPQGSCTDTGAVCAGAAGGIGVCLTPCTPASTYISTGGCPTGSRCFTLGEASAYCFPDCEGPSDCSTNSCDGEGSCSGADAPPSDGGVLDAGDVDAGDIDAGSPDAGEVDAGSPAAVEVVSCEGATVGQTVNASVGDGFLPSPTTVSPGEIVRFNNSDSFGHTVTSGTVVASVGVPTGIFNESLAGSGSVCLRFNTLGTYPYYCNIHTSMTGTVNVVDL